TDADARHLAELYLERGAPDDALKLLRGLHGSSDLLMRCLEAVGEWAELAALLEVEAPRRMPNDARALYLRAAQVHSGPLNQPERAAELLERAIPLGPSDAEIWARLGGLYSGPLGDREKGARCWARAWAADKSKSELLLLLADYHLRQGEWEPARDYFEEALKKSAVPRDQLGRVRVQLAEIARRLLDPEAEEAQLKQAA